MSGFPEFVLQELDLEFQPTFQSYFGIKREKTLSSTEDGRILSGTAQYNNFCYFLSLIFV